MRRHLFFLIFFLGLSASSYVNHHTTDKRATRKDLKQYLAFLAEEKYIEKAILNDDGSIVFNLPTFMGAWLNKDDHNDSQQTKQKVCQFLLPGKEINEEASRVFWRSLSQLQTASLSRYCTFDESGSPTISSKMPKGLVVSAMCVLKNQGPVSTRFRYLVHDHTDDNYIIKNPRFKWLGNNYSLSRYNDTNILCELFGYDFGISKKVTKPWLFESDAIRLDQEGHFAEFVNDQYGYVSELVCGSY